MSLERLWILWFDTDLGFNPNPAAYYPNPELRLLIREAGETTTSPTPGCADQARGSHAGSYVGPGRADDIPPRLSLPRRKQVLSLGCMSGVSLALWIHQRTRQASLPPRSPRPSAPNSSAPAEAESVEGRGPLSRGLCSFPASAPSQYPAVYSLQLARMS